MQALRPMLDQLEEEQAKLSSLGWARPTGTLSMRGQQGPFGTRKLQLSMFLSTLRLSTTDGLTGAYTLYSITSLFAATTYLRRGRDWIEVPDPDDVHPPSPTASMTGEASTRITVHRRFSPICDAPYRTLAASSGGRTAAAPRKTVRPGGSARTSSRPGGGIWSGI